MSNLEIIILVCSIIVYTIPLIVMINVAIYNNRDDEDLEIMAAVFWPCLIVFFVLYVLWQIVQLPSEIATKRKIRNKGW